MREISVPAVVDPDPSGNLTDLVLANVDRAPDAVAFSSRAAQHWIDVTNAEFASQVIALAKGLVASGVGQGDRVALMSKTRYEWTLADFAIWFAGGVTVPVYETSSAEQVAWILRDSAAVAAVVETVAHTVTVGQVRERLPDLRHVWCLDDGAVAELGTDGAAVADAELEARRSRLDGASLATIIYTSGTTGRPKGCELTHANFLELARNTREHLAEVVLAEGASTLLFLPLAHVFARLIQVLAVASGVRIGHTSDMKNLVTELGEFRPTFVLAVPRVFEKIVNSAEAKAEAAGKGRVFLAAADAAVDWSRALDAGRIGLPLRLRHAMFERLVYQRIRHSLGGQVAYAVSGGAPLGERLGHFFRGIGVPVLEGWGLTETTAPATVNTPEELRVGSVGRPLPGVCVRVAEDGELLVHGINVMHGYHRNPVATDAVLVDGWLHTGDLGHIDVDGYVQITGRKKEIIVTAAGKNVAPTVLEDRLRAHPLVSQCMVVGDQRPFVAALVTLDAEMLPAWLAHHGKPDLDVPAAARDPLVTAEVQRAVDHANDIVSAAESIRRFSILDVDFTESAGQLTPKLSLRRDVLAKEFAGPIEDLYA